MYHLILILNNKILTEIFYMILKINFKEYNGIYPPENLDVFYRGIIPDNIRCIVSYNLKRLITKPILK